MGDLLRYSCIMMPVARRYDAMDLFSRIYTFPSFSMIGLCFLVLSWSKHNTRRR